MAARNLERSIDFYSRVFGFRVESRSERAGLASVCMTGPANLRLVMHSNGDGVVRPVATLSRVGFLVDNLDDVRASLWDSGVSVARDSGEPDQIFRHSHGRSLYVRDPDGNEIELVEDAGAGGRAAFDHGCRLRRWGFVSRRRVAGWKSAR